MRRFTHIIAKMLAMVIWCSFVSYDTLRLFHSRFTQ